VHLEASTLSSKCARGSAASALAARQQVLPNFLGLFSDANPWITVTLAMIGKFQIAASFAVIYVYAGELMPTVVRSEAMGISSFVAGIGLLLFPYINSLVNQ
jgi:hypothetical protein